MSEPTKQPGYNNEIVPDITGQTRTHKFAQWHEVRLTGVVLLYGVVHLLKIQTIAYLSRLYSRMVRKRDL